MLALKVMLAVYAVIAPVTIALVLVWPRAQRWLIVHGARDPQWLNLGDEPRGFKQFRDDLRSSAKHKR